MTTQRSLSAAGPNQRGHVRPSAHSTSDQWHRHSCLCAFAAPRIPKMPTTATSLAFKFSSPHHPCTFLIANARLKFHATHRKISQLKIPNRERIAIFHSFFQRPTSLPAQNRTPSQIRASLPAPFTIHESQVTSHSFLICSSAIRNPRKGLKTWLRDHF